MAAPGFVTPPPPWYLEGWGALETARSRSLPETNPVRGRTLQRTARSSFSHQPYPDSRASSASSVRSMIEECLERAHHDRLQSGSREHSTPPSPFQEHSPFHEEHAKATSLLSQSSNDSFGSAFLHDRRTTTEIDDRRVLQHKKRCTCAYCTPGHRPRDEIETCGYCDYAFPSFIDGQMHPDHLAYFRRHEENIEAKRSFWMYHFPQCSSGHPRNSVDERARRIEKGREQQSMAPKLVMATPQADCQSSATLISTTSSLSKAAAEPSESTDGYTETPFDCLMFLDKSQRSSASTAKKRDLSRDGTACNSKPGQKRNLSLSLMISTLIDATPCGSTVSEVAQSRVQPAASANVNARATIWRACTECRKKRSKCDGCKPCGRCQASGQSESCRYLERNPPMTSSQNHGSTSQSTTTPSASHTNLTRSSSAPETSAESTDPPSRFKCQICERTFSRRTILLNHQRSHTGEKPFACSISGCDKTFAQQGDKTRHVQAQHSEKTFTCSGTSAAGQSWGCGKAFRRKDGLLEHHQKTAKGRRCIAERNKILALGVPGGEITLADQ